MPRHYRPTEVITVLESLGWAVDRQRGSHVILTKTGERNHLVVPLSRREVAMGTFRSIIKKAGATPTQFDSAADEVL